MVEVLVSRGVKLTREQLREALEVEKNDRHLAEILISRNLVSGEDVARAIAEATSSEYVSLSEASVDPAVVNLVDEKVLRKHGALPLKVEGEHLVLAMSDPTNVLVLDGLKALSSYPIRPVVAAEESIGRLQDRMFWMGKEISKFLKADKPTMRHPVGSALSVSGAVDEGAPTARLANSIIRRALTDEAPNIHIESPTRRRLWCATGWMAS
jgi:type IV pilus assembly protein PilB